MIGDEPGNTRVVQTAAKLVLEPIFEADLDPAAYGYRPGRSGADAIKAVHGLLCRGSTDVVDADLLRGWSAYFGYGTRLPAYRAIDNHVYDRVRRFLVRRHKAPSHGTNRFPREAVFGALGGFTSGVCTWDLRRGPRDEASRKAGCGKSARPV